ncbi:MAG TPA: PQQ-binding-like beta-propeller repeat protein [Conexibacter sp.]|nr:PQQ-binding-like beta-propeller repeat protein [Conexibacter sp.]
MWLDRVCSAARDRRRALVLCALAVGVLAGCGGSQRQVSSIRRTTWTAPNAGIDNARQVGGPIDSSTVSRLRVAWRLPLVSSYATTPVVANGVLYTQDLSSNVLALRLHSGKLLWEKRFDATDIGPNGVNVVDGRVYGATPRQAFALDARTGKVLWRKTIARRAGDTVDMAPGHWKRTVYVSTAVQGPGAVGTLWALDAATGRTRWRWEQVPRGLWGDRKLNAGGGLWHPPAFDGRGGLYMGIANPLPFPGTTELPWGASRPGANRWNNSIVKLDARTGRFIWGRQVLPHDIYDWDLECPVILTTVQHRRVALAAGKMGVVYAFDAMTGTRLWKQPVGIHNGHDGDNLLALHKDYDGLKPPMKIYPGNWGGVETQMASDGATVYVPVNNLYIVYRSQTSATSQDTSKGTGEIVALDEATGSVKWDRKLPHSVYGAASIANDLVFTTTYDGMLWALNRDTGEIVWRSRLPAGTDAPVAISDDMLITAGSLQIAAGQKAQIVAYRLGR